MEYVEKGIKITLIGKKGKVNFRAKKKKRKEKGKGKGKKRRKTKEEKNEH